MAAAPGRPVAGSGVTIRRIGADEVDLFRRIRLEALRAEPSVYASTAEDWERLSPDAWRARLAEAVVVALAGDGPVGVMGLMPQRASRMAHRGTLVMAYVRADQRGGGVASALLDALGREALTQGIVQLELAVSAENEAAIRFYRRRGFAECGRVPGGFRIGGREIDEILMMRRLDL
jgi:L-amino acid N-acyltransferase YncA